MIILFEEYLYPLAQIDNLLSEKYYDDLKNSYCKVNYVGYYFDASKRASPVIILPKVFINEQGNAFGTYNPIDFLEIETNRNLQESLRKEHKLAFLYSISTWLYLSIKKFNDRKSASNITDVSELNQIVSSFGKQDISELEIVRSLMQFNHENQQLFTFIKKTNSSQNHKTDWSKTISRKTAYFQNGSPHYLDTLNKQKTIHYDEELIVLFMSVLQSFNQKYFLKIPINSLYKTLSAAEFKSFINNGTRTLKRIKYKYFNDKLLKLWHLLYVFCERNEKIKAQKSFKEVLLVRDFNIVFEDMIDSLLAEENLPKGLKEQDDGKVLDHIYEYQDLLTNQDTIYHIADSKYYGANAKLSKYDREKQYTYAKNVIQYNVDWLNDDKDTGNIRYRDELTEGYNVTPNFFISAFVNDNLDFREDGLKFKENFKRNNHFTNRLFDRDTLILQAYNINFLFVLSSYIQNSNSQKETFKKHTRKQFRIKLVQYLTDKFEFRKIIVASDIEQFVEQNFKKLQGKIYRPSGWGNELLLAVEKGEDIFILNGCKIENYVLGF
jgi:hypothetical protein